MDLAPLAGQMFKVLGYLIPVVVLILALKSRLPKRDFRRVHCQCCGKNLVHPAKAYVAGKGLKP